MPEPVARIAFDLSLYRLEAVQAAVEAFAGFATIDLAVGPTAAEVAIVSVPPAHAAVLEHELANFALFQSAVLARTAP